MINNSHYVTNIVHCTLYIIPFAMRNSLIIIKRQKTTSKSYLLLIQRSTNIESRKKIDIRLKCRVYCL